VNNKVTVMKILTVLGARPQFIKAAVVSRAFISEPEIQEVLLHTGQHYDYGMSEVFFTELDIPKPAYNLGIGSGTHGQQTARMLSGIEEILLHEQPDLVIVYGDTNSTLAGALAAAKLHIPIAHVEAGLRSFNRQMPEEINRVLTDHASDYLFAPTETAIHNLTQEGIPPHKTFLVGDVMYDASLYFANKAAQQSRILETLSLQPRQFCLATVHRAENTDDPQRLQNIFNALINLSKTIQIVLPLHPRTRKVLQSLDLIETVQQSICLIEPVGYLDMTSLEKNSKLILTDSGGIQKEAYFLEVPCVVLREETEWVELLEVGWNILASPTSKDSLANAIQHHLTLDPSTLERPSFYGDGKTGERILDLLKPLST
jgi:UDP-GlcNAc3NAcA epimerase